MTQDFRKSPPAPLTGILFNLPMPYESKLGNGVRVIVFEDRKLPLVSFRLAFLSGDIDDPEGSKGLTSAMTSLLTQGTNTRSSKQIAEEVEKLGASLSAGSSSDNTIIAASALKIYKSEILGLMADITLNPSFPDNELSLYKQNTIKNLQFQRSQPDFLADEQVSRVIFGNHPYGVISPTVADIKKITQENIIEYHKQCFDPGNAIFIVVGDVDKNEIVNEINSHFGALAGNRVSGEAFPETPVRDKRTATIVDRVGSAQANIVISNKAIDRKHPDYFPIIVMNQVLGAGASSRLFMNIREEKGYTYGAYSSFDMRRHGGAFEATAEVRTAVIADSLKEFFYEINRIREEPVSKTELDDAKNFLTGVFPIRAETQEGLTNLIVSQKLYDLPDDYLQTYRDKIQAVTVEDVQRAAETHIKPAEAAIVIVGDAEEVLPQVKAYAESVEIFDTDGNQMELAKYEAKSDVPDADFAGNWSLTIDAQGQQFPLTLNVAEGPTGTLESPFGTGNIKDAKVTGNKIKASIALDFQGQEVEVTLVGQISENGEMKGNISAESAGLSELPFSGMRK